MFQTGDNVKIKSPFDVSYPLVYQVISIVRPGTYKIDVFNDGTGADFDDIYLEAA